MSPCNVIRADTMGFCMGVKRAVNIVEELLDQHLDAPIYTIGPLIHNPLVIHNFEKRGVFAVNDISEIKNGTAVIRAHGITPQLRHTLEKKNIGIVDATCPRVLQSQDLIEEYSDKGYFIVIVGDKNHGEVGGLAGFAKKYVVIRTPEETENIPTDKNILVIAQTTMKKSTYSAISEIIKNKVKDAVICSSLCGSVEKRQIALKELAAKVDAILVIGGKNSANTRNLYDAAKILVENVWHIESPKEIPAEITRCKTVGISAGASTPEWIIREVEEQIKKMQLRMQADGISDITKRKSV